MDRIDEIQARCNAGRPIPRIDVKYLLAEIKRLRMENDDLAAYGAKYVKIADKESV